MLWTFVVAILFVLITLIALRVGGPPLATVLSTIGIVATLVTSTTTAAQVELGEEVITFSVFPGRTPLQALIVLADYITFTGELVLDDLPPVIVRPEVQRTTTGYRAVVRFSTPPAVPNLPEIDRRAQEALRTRDGQTKSQIEQQMQYPLNKDVPNPFVTYVHVKNDSAKRPANEVQFKTELRSGIQILEISGDTSCSHHQDVNRHIIEFKQRIEKGDDRYLRFRFERSGIAESVALSRPILTNFHQETPKDTTVTIDSSVKFDALLSDKGRLMLVIGPVKGTELLRDTPAGRQLFETAALSSSTKSGDEQAAESPHDPDKRWQPCPPP